MREAVLDAGHGIEHLAHFVHQRLLALHAPLALRLQQQVGVGLVEPHRIKTDFIGAGTGHDAVHLRDGLHDGALDFQVKFGTLFEADRGEFLDADNQIAFVHRWHEGLAHLGVDDAGCQQHDHRHGGNDALPSQPPDKRWLIQRKQLARQPRIFMPDFTQQVGREDRNDGERQYQRASERKDDGQRHRHKVLAFKALQCQQRKEHRDDDQDTGCDGNRHFAHRPVDGVQPGQFPGGGIGRKTLHDVFHHDHRSINQHADRNGQTAQAHQVGRHAKGAHQDKSNQCRQGKHQRHRQCSADIAQEQPKQHNHQHSRFNQRGRHGIYGLGDQ